MACSVIEEVKVPHRRQQSSRYFGSLRIDIDDPQPPPCARCRREGTRSECIVSTKRQKLSSRSEIYTTLHNGAMDATHEALAASEKLPPRESPSYRNTNVSSLATLSQGRAIERIDSQRESGSSDQHQNQQQGNHNVERPPIHNPTESIIGTLFSKPNDALTLLFHAASAQHEEDGGLTTNDITSSEDEANHGLSRENQLFQHSDGLTRDTPERQRRLSSLQTSLPSKDILNLWKSSRFVRQGWLTAHEAIMYADLYVNGIFLHFVLVFLRSRKDSSKTSRLCLRS